MSEAVFMVRNEFNEGRECGCPDWVKRCAHFGGKWIALHEVPRPGSGWAVCGGPEPATYLPHSEGHANQNRSDIALTQADAITAFFAMETELRGAEEALP